MVTAFVAALRLPAVGTAEAGAATSTRMLAIRAIRPPRQTTARAAGLATLAAGRDADWGVADLLGTIDFLHALCRDTPSAQTSFCADVSTGQPSEASYYLQFYKKSSGCDEVSRQIWQKLAWQNLPACPKLSGKAFSQAEVGGPGEAGVAGVVEAGAALVVSARLTRDSRFWLAADHLKNSTAMIVQR